MQRNSDSPKSHVSVLNISSTPQANIRLTSPRKLEMASSQVDEIYTLYMQLEERMSKQEEKMDELQQQVRDKDEVISDLRQQLLELRDAPAGVADAPNLAAPTTSIDDRCFLETVRREMPKLSEGCAGAEANIAAVMVELETAKASVSGLKEKLKRVNRKCHLEGEQRDQYSRRETLRVSGVTYKRGEDTTNLMCRIACSVGVTISPSDISVSHRNGRRVGDAPRPILCRFVRRETKNMILSNRKLAASITTGDEGEPVRIFIDENLTPMRAKICTKLRKDKIPHHTKDGKVYISTSENEYKVYDTPADWEGLDWPESVKTEVGIYPQD